MDLYPNSCEDADSQNMNSYTPSTVIEESVKKNSSKDLDADLLSLKISTPRKSSGTFYPQNLFRDNACRRNIVQPSKFGKHFITQASWVAGGYWRSPGSPQRRRLTTHDVSHLDGENLPAFTASRSSSHSSGFVSQLSECASSKSQSTFQNGSKYSFSQQSFTANPNDRESVYMWNRTPTNLASSFTPLAHPNLDSFEAQSACSASSYMTDNSQAGALQLSTQHSSCLHDSSPPLLHKSNIISSNAANFLNKSNVMSYFNLGMAFILGLSVSANIFLIAILYNTTRQKGSL